MPDNCEGHLLPDTLEMEPGATNAGSTETSSLECNMKAQPIVMYDCIYSPGHSKPYQNERLLSSAVRAGRRWSSLNHEDGVDKCEGQLLPDSDMGRVLLV